MKTEDLVTMLATGTGAIDSHAVVRRFIAAGGVGMLGAAALMIVLLGTRHDMIQAMTLPMFWVKLGYVACLAAAGMVALVRLSRPGLTMGRAALGLAAPVIAIWLVGGVELAASGAADRADLLFGKTWRSCPLLIALLAIPAFITCFWAVRGLAPTRLRLAGGAAGFASGAIAAVVYSMHCPEMGAPFIGVWYLLGMLVPAAVGALLGPRLLRW